MNKTKNTLRKVAYIFYIISCCGLAISGIFSLIIAITSNVVFGYSNGALNIFAAILIFIPLAWVIPMTLRAKKIYEDKEEPSILFCILTLFFCNFISGILLIICAASENDDDYNTINHDENKDL